jgi:hypothetical protein
MGWFSWLIGQKEHSEEETLADFGYDPDLFPNLEAGADMDVDLSGLDQSDDTGDVEVTEADMQDPGLLADLKDLGWESAEVDDAASILMSDADRSAALASAIAEGKARFGALKAEGRTKDALEELKRIKALVTEQTEVNARLAATTPEYPIATDDAPPPPPPAPPASAPVDQEPAAAAATPASPSSLELAEQIASAKRRVLALKEAGCKEETLEELRALKALQARLNNMASSSVEGSPDPAPIPLPRPFPLKAASSREQRRAELANAIASSKREAVAFRREGHNDRALEMLKHIKALEKERTELD